MKRPHNRWLVAIGLVMPFHALADPTFVSTLTLYANSTVQIDRKRPGNCHVVTNTTSDSIVVIPLDEVGWRAFAASDYPFVSIKKCQMR